ncbi:MAG: radical SAM protein [Candidatus Gracilibacteria bacterium]|nr:radical SAM protein [Candidatus Gracilibacteria bacterium]
MNTKFKLGNIILRKEFFGGIIYNHTIKNYKQINKDAYLILRLLNKPLTINELINTLKLSDLDIEIQDLEKFFNDFSKDKTIIVDSDESDSEAMIFFDNIDYKDMKTDRLNAPTNMSIYITQRCPKACKHCVSRSAPNAPHDYELNKEQWFKVLKDIRNSGVTTIVISGGEPMIKENIFDIIEEADRLKLSLILLSDYDEMTENIANRIKNIKNLEDFQVSLDGATEKTHDWMRGEGSFEKSKKRMKLLANAGIKYTVSSVIHKNNLFELESMVKLVNELGATFHYISPLSPYGRGFFMNKYLLSDDELKILGQSYIKYVRDGLVRTRNSYWVNNVGKADDKDFHPFKKSLTLISNGFYNFSVKWQGDCYLDSKLGSSGTLKLGNVLENSILEIWNNPKLDKLRGTYGENKSIYINEENINNYI